MPASQPASRQGVARQAAALHGWVDLAGGAAHLHPSQLCDAGSGLPHPGQRSSAARARSGGWEGDVALTGRLQCSPGAQKQPAAARLHPRAFQAWPPYNEEALTRHAGIATLCPPSLPDCSWS